MRINEISKKTGEDNNGAEELLENMKKSHDKFCEGMDDDFNTSLAIGALFEMVKDVNRYIDLNGNPSEQAKEALRSAKESITNVMEKALGVKLNTENEVKAGITSDLIDFIVELRWDAKQGKNWAMADKIRDRLKDMWHIVTGKQIGRAHV